MVVVEFVEQKSGLNSAEAFGLRAGQDVSRVMFKSGNLFIDTILIDAVNTIIDT
jgi:hypothetical protein